MRWFLLITAGCIISLYGMQLHARELFLPPALDYESFCKNEPATKQPALKGRPADQIYGSELWKYAQYYLYDGPHAGIDIHKARTYLQRYYEIDSTTMPYKAKQQYARMVFSGKGGFEDRALGIRIMRESELKDPSGAGYKIAQMLFRQQLSEQAIPYLKRSAASGNSLSALMLSLLYRNNDIISSNATEQRKIDALGAFARQQIAVKLAKKNCNILRSVSLLLRSRYNPFYDPDEALAWLKAASQSGDTEAVYEYATHILNSSAGGRFIEAETLLLRNISMHHTPSMHRLAEHYMLQDKQEEATELFERAAARNYRPSINYLHKIYSGENGDTPHMHKARRLLERAIRLFDSDAAWHVQLARYYQLGLGGEQNLEKAFMHYKVAAQDRNLSALIALGDAYYYGLGTHANPTTSLRYYRLAADSGKTQAISRIIQLYQCNHAEKNTDIEKWVENADYLRAPKGFYDRIPALMLGKHTLTTLDKLLEDVRDGKRQAMLWLMRIYREGIGVTPNREQATYWQNKLLEPGNAQPKGLRLFGQYLLEKSQTATQENLDGADIYNTALDMLDTAAHAGDLNAQYILAQIYHEKKDDKNAQYWMNIAAQRGHKAAMRKLARIEKEGGHKWLIRAAHSGDIYAMISLAGTCKSKDCTHASYEWLKKAERAHLCDVNKMIKIATAYNKGIAGKAHKKRGDALLWKASQNGHAGAMRLLAEKELKTPDFSGIPPLLFKAAENGDIAAMKLLAHIYDTAMGVSRDSKKARIWWQRAAKEGDVEALTMLNSDASLSTTHQN